MRSGTKPHPTFTILAPDISFVDIDRKMVDLVQTFWGHGVTTYYCCEGNPSTATTTDDINRAYILIERTPATMALVAALFTNFEPLTSMTPTLWSVEIDNIYGNSRICLRFPQAQIDALNTFVFETLEQY